MAREEFLLCEEIGNYDKPTFTLERAREINTKAVWRFAVWRPRGGIGDLLMLTPTLRSIKQVFPNCKLTMVTASEYCHNALVDVLWGNPHIDRIIDFRKMNSKDYDLILNMDCPCVEFEQPGRKPVSRVELFASAAGVPLRDMSLVYTIKPEEKKWLKEFFLARQIPTRKPFIVYHPFASNRKRSVDTDMSKQILGELRERWHKCSIIVPTHQTDWSTSVDFGSLMNCYQAKNYSIRLLAALVSAADVVIAPDSSLLHLAGAFGTPLVGLFGPTYAPSRMSIYPHSVAVVTGKGLNCYPCWYDQCRFKFACWQRLEAKDVIKATEKALHGDYDQYTLTPPEGGSLRAEEF